MTEFDDVIRRLEGERPQATARELDEIKQRVRRRAADPSRNGNQSMKSRFAILGMLVTGMLFSTAGAGLAVQGFTGSTDNAAVAQYGTPTPTGGVLPAEEENAPDELASDNTGAAPGGEVTGREDAQGVAGVQRSATVTQPERQLAASAQSGELPLTGFAALPVLVGGLVLLAGGLLLRRRSRER